MTSPEILTIQGERRTTVGKNVRFLRRQGITPANLYGRGNESVSFQVETRALDQIIQAGARSSIVDVSIGAETYSALLKVLQRHPVTRQPLHVEFYRVDANRPVQTQVQLHVIGEAPAARLPAALISQLLHEITVEC